ncbi:aminotransferase class I/II-fold pyridoxal phosphate-dependent enzyme [Desulfomicrobium escambiense]|uniref:aminotransferase class I/II-fold pyridoxal phosphate-dependent enzyme n=1 Tax=Desulfomicrobium escambiense TaxID=29503 RepID=UPI000421110E|nr:aminotransferase class I/II-fold pyridoxal phosphate-dependent enzyme [Desulfomicrobium escambiense]
MHPLLSRLRADVEARKAAGLGRELLAVSEHRDAFAVVEGRELLDFSSNDFLGLAQDRAMAAHRAELCHLQGCGSGSSRLVTGTSSATVEAERALAAHFGYESCLILGSGFLANLTLLATIFNDKDTLALDKRAHASTMAGVRHSRAAFHTFRHNRLSHLEKILQTHPVQAVLTESLFSMDGDSPDFVTLKRLKDEFGFLCVVDEAHAFGVLGEGGRGLAQDVADVAVGTLGKAFGLFGAFILCPEAVRDHLVHFGQGFIYTTALPPWHGDMVAAMLERVAAADEARTQLKELGDEARRILGDLLPVRGAAHILALEVGDEARSVRLAEGLRSRGVLVFAARYPTVPLGQAILRVNLTSLHTRRHVETLRDALSATLREES